GRLPLKADLAVVLAKLGDVELCDRNDPKAALAHYQEHVKLYRELTTSEEIAGMRRRLSQAYYRSATAALHAGDQAASERDFRLCLRLREDFNRDYPTNLGGGSELMLVRARCGLIGEATAAADNLERHPTAGKSPALLFQAACAYALCAAAAEQGRPDGDLS